MRRYPHLRPSLIARLSAVALLLGFSLIAEAQNNSGESPYTRFGLGRLAGKGLTLNRAMGGIGVGLNDNTSANPVNPASYAAVDSMTFIFDMAASTGTAWYKDEKNSTQRWLGNVEYMTILFPLAKRVGLSLGAMPFSYSGYQFGSVGHLSGDAGSSYSRLYTGRGNLNQIYLGMAVRPIKSLSVGFNAAYIFGRFDHIRTVSYPGSAAFSPVLQSSLKLNGFMPQIGMQYRFDLAGNRQLTLGLTYSPSMYMKSRRTAQQMLAEPGAAAEVVAGDTVNASRAYSLPHMIGAGFTYAFSGKLLLGADVTYGKWGSALYAEKECRLQDQWQWALGGQYTPDISDRNLFKSMRYRFGLHGANSYIRVPAGGGFRSYYTAGASVGVGIPLVDGRSILHLALEYERLLPVEKVMVGEQFLRLTLGLSFNEGWFRKLKIN